MSFNYKNPISPITSLGVVSVPRTEVYGTNFSVLSTGGYMEVYSLNDLYYTIPSGTTGLVEYTGNTIPIQFQKGTGSVFSPDVLTLNSDNISSGRRRIGMLVYVIDQDQIYQYQIPNFENLWTGATSANGPGGPTVVMSDFGTTIKSNTPEGIAFISGWTANTIEGISGETSLTAVWRKLVTGGGGVSGDFLPLSGGTVTGDTIFTSGLTANTFSASTYLGLPPDVFVTGGTYSAGTATFTNNTGGTFDVSGFYTGGTDVFVTGATYDDANTFTFINNTGGTFNVSFNVVTGLTATTISATTYENLPIDVFVTGGTYSAGTATFTNNTGGTFNVTGLISANTYTTGFTFDVANYDLTIKRNDGVDLTTNLSILASDVTITGGTYNPSTGTATFTNNTGGTFNVTGFLTGFTDIYVTGGTFDKNSETLTLQRNDGNSVIITGFTDVFVTGGTYSAGTITFTNNSGGTFNVGGLYTGSTDVFVTGATYNDANTFTFTNNTGGTFDVSFNIVTGLTATTISAATYENLPLDVFVTGGTYSGGTATFTNNTGGTFDVTGFYTGSTDVYVTGGTFSKSGETLTLSRNDDTTIPITGFTDVFVTGGTYSNGILNLTNNSGYTFSVPGFSTATGGTSNYYGSFTDDRTQSVSGTNIATVWKYNTTEIANGIYIQDETKIKVANSGIYEIGFSAQLVKDQGGASTNVTIWASINGTPVPRTSSVTSFEANNSYQLPFVSYIFELNAGDYVEFYFSSPNSSVKIEALSGFTSPSRPDAPSIIILAKDIGNAVLNTSGDSFVTGFSLTNSTLNLSQNRVGQYSGFSVNLPFLPLTGGTLTGSLTVSGSVNATTYYGSGANLTGISKGGGGAGGQIYYFNISNTQTPYYEFSTTATTVPEQTISATASPNSTVLIGGFMTPSGVPNITNFPAGILTFYLHAYDGGANHNFDIYCELYKRTTGGTETLIFTSDVAAVIGSTVSMVISDGYFSGATLNSSDRLVAKLYGTNLTAQSRTIYFVSEDYTHYSFALTTIPAFTDTYVTGFTYSNNTLTIKQNNNQPDLTATINLFTGLTATTISATTYQNLPIDVFTTGATYNNANEFTFTNNTGGTFNVSFNRFTGITATTISATTYQNLPTDIRVTGGTYSNGTAIFTNNTGGTFNVTGFYTGGTDVFVTGATYNNANTFTFTNNTGGTFNTSFNTVTGLTVNGILSGTTISGGTLYGDGSNLTNLPGGSLGLTFSLANNNYYT